MTIVNLDNGIVFESLRPPPLRLLVFVSNKYVRDVNGLHIGKIMLKLARWDYLITSAERSRVWGTFVGCFNTDAGGP